MHPIITLDLMKTRASDLHRQAGRDTLSLAARGARQAPTKKSAPFMPAPLSSSAAYSPCSMHAGPRKCLTAAANTSPRP